MAFMERTHGRNQRQTASAAAQPGDVFSQNADCSGDDRFRRHQPSV
jgi:hypothetical protein